MAREKKPVHKVQMTEGKREIIQKLLQEYEIQSAQDIQEALKDLLGGTIKEMMEAEMALMRRRGVLMRQSIDCLPSWKMGQVD